MITSAPRWYEALWRVALPFALARLWWRGRKEPGELPKVAVRPFPGVRIHQGNHGADYGITVPDQLVIRHYPYRSAEQFERKVRNGAAAYAATNLADDIGAHWRQYGEILESEGPDALAGVFHKWFFYPRPDRHREICFDPCPR